jgi:murein DD-endopeptidase MepM/ murein hydrolase activator NlpD
VREAQPIFAPTDAEVRFVGKIADKNVLSLVHSQGYRTSFEPVCSDMFAGQRVKKGDVIGRVCLLGYKSHCKVTCLHYGMRIGENYLSPLALAGAIAPSHTVHYARG